MCADIVSDPSLMSLGHICDALQLQEANGQSHNNSRTGRDPMASLTYDTGCWRPGHDRWPDQRIEVSAPVSVSAAALTSRVQARG